jgi:phosphoglycolate phosphatase-like HAD superfamily hydrolase
LANKLIVLDADGVLLDYNLAYASAWKRAFGSYPQLKNHNAYWARDRWAVRQLEGDSLSTFRTVFDDSFWSTIPAIKGALDACHALSQIGYELICVTALPQKFQPARLRNLFQLGFPIETVLTVDHSESTLSPKAEIINSLKPVVFVDDFLPYKSGVHVDIHRALITREHEMSPNEGPLLDGISSVHRNLEDFARFWLNR